MQTGEMMEPRLHQWNYSRGYAQVSQMSGSQKDRALLNWVEQDNDDLFRGREF